jgi:hypothetical protein
MSVLYSVSSWGQAATYDIATTSGTYTEITGGTVMLSGAGLDDGSSTVQTINSFTFNGTATTSFSASSNGYIAIGGTGAVASNYSPLSTAVTATGALGVISAYGRDLQSVDGTTELRWEYLGGSNETVIQWKNWRRFGVAAEVLNFQIRLNHTSNTISLVYGTMTFGNNTTYPQVGFKNGLAAGTIGTTLSNLTIKNIPAGTNCTWANAVSGRLASETMLGASTLPLITCPSGTTFTFTPQTGTIVNPVTTFQAATGVTSSAANITWTAPTNATQYDVQYRAVGSCAWTQFSTGQAGTSAAFTGLLPLTSYQVRVRARSATNNCRYSHCGLGNNTANSDGYIATGYFTTLAGPATVTQVNGGNPLCSNGNQSVIITGTSFSGATAVTFNGVNAVSFVVNSATQVTATTPAGVTAGNVVVTTAVPTPVGLAYTVYTSPSVSIAPNDTIAACGSYPQVVTASGATTYAWTAISGSLSNLSNPSISSPTVNATGNGTYQVTGTALFGCFGRDTLVVQFSPAPYVAITPTIGQFCGAGGTTNVAASSANDPNYTYTFTSLQTGILSNTLAASTDFTVTQSAALRIEAVDNTAQCRVVRDTSISVYAFPTLTLTATPDTLCATGATATLGSGLVAGNFAVSSIPASQIPIPGNATYLMTNGVATTPLSGGSMDDGGWGGIPIGFTFNYFGSSFTTLGAGTNGLLMFGTIPGYGTGSGQLGQFSFAGPPVFPNVGNPANVIALLAADMQMANSTSGSISYWTQGYAPNRIFVINYQQVHGWSNNPAATVQCKLYETTGIVDIVIVSKTFTNPATVGLQDATKTIGAVAPGRSGSWTVTVPEAWRFTPPSNYNCTWTPPVGETVAIPGTNLNQFTNTTGPLNNVGTQTFTFAAQNLTTGCVGGGTVDVEVLAVPGTVAGGDLEAYGSVLGAGSAGPSPLNNVCGDQTVTYSFTGTLAPGEVVKWYSAPTGGTLLATGSTYTSGVYTPGTYNVYAEFDNGFCASASRTQFTVNVATPPAITLSLLGPEGDLVRCDASGFTTLYTELVDANSVNDPNYTYTWTPGDANATIFNQIAIPSPGTLDWHSDTTTVATVTAFDAGTGCQTDTTVSLSVFAIPAVTPFAAADTVCLGDSTLLSSGVAQGTFSANCIPVALRTPVGATSLVSNPDGATPTYGVAPTSQGLPFDDCGWSGIPIGFTFNYFGTNFTTINVGSNGTATFGAYNAAQVEQFFFSSWPSLSNPLNCIAVIATDLRFNTVDAAGAQIRYWTEGIAPNRVFVLEYFNVPGWSGTVGNQWVQLHLFETTGRVEIHAEEATYTGSKSIALQDGTGTIGTAAPRCFASGVWNALTNTIPAAFSEAWRFNPPVNYSFNWELNAQISGSDANADAMALPTALGTETYSVQITDNTSGCVGAPATVDVEVVPVPAAPVVTGEGDFSGVATSGIINFCGDQTVTMSVTGGASPGWIARYYDAPTGGTLLFTANPWNASYTTPILSASDSVWVAVDNGFCEGARGLVEMIYQTPDPINISFISGQAVVCVTVTFSAELQATSTSPYTYTWSPGAIVGASTGTINYNNTVVYQVDGTDGYCYNTAIQSLSRFDFPTVSADAQFDSVCLGNQSVLSALVDTVAFTVQGIGYSPTSFVSPNFLVQNSVAIVPTNQGFGLDDAAWWNIPLGFSYDFFGNTYTTVHVSTNGNIQFGATPISTSFSPGAIPSPIAPNNYVAAAWTDWNFGNLDPNSIRYETIGFAPNRVFAILFDGTAFGEAGASRYTSQIELYETTGEVEIHVQQVTDSGTNNIIVGVEDLTGTIGSAAPGRTGIWNTIAPEAWRFIPPRDYSFAWSPALEIVGPTNGISCVAQPAGPGTTNYQLVVTDILTTCDNSVNNQTIVPVGIVSAPPIATYSASPALGTTGGVLTTHTMTPNAPEVGGDVYVWTITPATFNFVNGTNANSRTPQVQFTAPGTYGVQLSISRCGGAPVVFSSPTVFNIAAVYCFPAFSNGCADGDLVDDVTIKNPQNVTIMAHLNTGCGGDITGFNDFTGAPINGVTTCTMYQGSSYEITVDGGGIFNEFYGVWLDVNDDGDFADAGECMGFTPTSALIGTFTIGVPTSNLTTYGYHRMRVITSFGAINAGSFCLNGTWGETHDYVVNIQPPVILNDIPVYATPIAFSSNVTFPNCVNLSGNTSLASNSPETAGTNGNDVWYRVVAQSTGLSITLTSNSMDDYIALYTLDGFGNYNLVAGGVENASSGAGDFERLNIGGLTAGTTYYIAVGSASNATAGAFTLCVQHLMKSWPTFVAVPGGIGHDLCGQYKATYRGTPAQGATYNFTFTGTGGGAPVGPGSVTGTNGLIVLSNPAIVPNMQYGGIYNCQVDMVYTLSPSTGGPEVITVIGSVADPNATGVTIRTQPLVEVRTTQRCPASLLRSNFLVGTPVTGSSAPCGVINYTYEFTQVVSCGDGTVVAGAVEYTTPGATPFLPLGVLPNLANVGAWDVRIRPNFNYGPGTYGPVQRVQVANTATSATIADNDMVDDVNKVNEFGVAANLYPNPNTGEMVNLNVSGVESDNVFVRVLDAMGRVVYSNRFTVDGSLNTIVTFAQPLASGIYNVEFTVDGDVITERMIVTKQ